MRSDVKQPPYGFERYRRLPVLLTPFGSSWNPNTGAINIFIAADNSGAAIPAPCEPPYIPHSTGAVGINKGIEIGYRFLPNGVTNPNDGLASVNDPDGHGFWRRIITLDFLIIPRSTAGPLSATSRAGGGMGAYAIVQPDPATTAINLARVYYRADNLTWELQTHKGDSASAAVITALTGVPNAVNGRCFKIRIVHNPGQYVRAYVNGILGAEATSSFQLPPGATAYTSCVSSFVSSGTGAANVRAWIGGHVVEVVGIG